MAGGFEAAEGDGEISGGFVLGWRRGDFASERCEYCLFLQMRGLRLITVQFGIQRTPVEEYIRSEDWTALLESEPAYWRMERAIRGGTKVTWCIPTFLFLKSNMTVEITSDSDLPPSLNTPQKQSTVDLRLAQSHSNLPATKP